MPIGPPLVVADANEHRTGRQLGGSLVRGGSGDVPALPLGADRGGIECGDDVVVGSVRGGGSMPGVPVGVVALAESLGDPPVRLPTFPARR